MEVLEQEGFLLQTKVLEPEVLLLNEEVLVLMNEELLVQVESGANAGAGAEGVTDANGGAGAGVMLLKMECLGQEELL